MRYLVLLLCLSAATAADAQTDIRLNQVGFYPDAPKVAVVTASGASGAFSVVREGDGATVYTGTLGTARTWSASGETVRQADFSAVTAPGSYTLSVEGVGSSYAFEIAPAALEGVARAALKGFYYQRASTALDAQYAGPWARAAGHPDTSVRVHASASTASRPTNTFISAPKGWYDAGDYNKYVVNSGISVGTLLSLYEWEPVYVEAFETGIPESGDAVPDLLDEVLWNVRWMLAMQDEDGGVYHKLTTANFSGEVMPANATAPRYVVQKGTAATLDFAATTAQASRIARGFEDDLPGLADSLLTASLDAWAWARANPNVRYDQGALNAAFDPNINTGEYGDGSFEDEFDWAGMELYVATRADSFLTITRPFDPIQLGLPYWGGVRELGYHSLLAHRAEIAADVDTTSLRNALLATAGPLASAVASTPYGVPMGRDSWNWGWGSNSVAANQGVALMVAYRLTGEARYLHAAGANLDYLLGRNATGYSFVTGIGDKSPRNPHHRPSRADGVADPVPGLLAGGPNPGQQDGCTTYPSALPARSYTDVWCSYASNEIAINWNAPLVFLAVSVEAARSATGVPAASEPVRPRPSLDLGVAPNPFGRAASVRFSLATPEVTTLRVLDARGREVLRLLDGVALGSGDHTLDLDASGLAPGLYVLRLQSGSRSEATSVSILR
ncbi:glycoside hydrolase family 9 protein [Rubricoccus marinus]|uniref:Endoglucanase n=1 Tax=Rubricoccus marinus TaxID=716817 RepID=A0A259TUB2_9BACT|nr:glycoside hydrolase family 9 protein [Rubricoccus marinus]OZC01321.1 hypothetical protein BSZ36_17910 [Rubricoccus marinus]